MYLNVGNKIKLFSKIIGWTLLTVGCIVWFALIINGEQIEHYSYYDGYSSEFEYKKADDIWAWVALVTGVLGFISSWIAYGLGQIVDDIHAMREKQVGLPKEEEVKAEQA